MNVLRARRQRGRRRDRRPGDAVAGRAAKLGPRRRRLHDIITTPRPRRLTVYDGRETAPAQAHASHVPRRRRQAAAVPRGGAQRPRDRRARRRSDARPGAWRTWPAAVEQPVRRRRAHRARRLHRQPAAGADDPRRLRRRTRAPDVRAYFAQGPDGTLLEAGDRLRNPAYADFLQPARRARAPDALYRGPTAARIVERTRAAPLGGSMTMADLAGYRAGQARAAVPALPRLSASACRRRRRAASACSSCCRSSSGPTSPRAARTIRRPGSCSPRRAGSCTPTATAMSAIRPSSRCRSRACSIPPMSPRARRLIGDRAGPPPAAGTPAGAPLTARRHARCEPAGTSHFIVRDAAGNVVSMTTTVESHLRLGPDGRRLLPQQPDDRLLLPAARRARAGRRPMRSRRARGRARR